ncbi:MAG: radical SAM protein [Victivallaceae bacterium]|nr:radical SAM protein [Victivallaceae bacterium]
MPCPPEIILELTARCNHACPFCYCNWHEEGETVPEDLPTSAWRKIIRHCVDAGALVLQFSGGEPLLRKDIGTLVSYARELLPAGGLMLFTNGTLMTPRRFAFLKRKSVIVGTSLPCLATYGAMTGRGRGRERILESIRQAAKSKWAMSVRITGNRTNAFEAVETVLAAAEAGAGAVMVEPAMLCGRAANTPELALERGEWNEIRREVEKLKLPRRMKPNFCDELVCECRDMPRAMRARYGVKDFSCTCGTLFGAVGPDGRYRRCIHLKDALPFPC